MQISQCYTLGDISRDGSGGITGSRTGRNSGRVEITNCYTQGDTTSTRAGGICGGSTGGGEGYNGGVVHISNVYASGSNTDGGGVIGEIHNDANEIKITMSVHNGEPIIGSGADSAIEATWNSDNLDDIRGKVFCYTNSHAHGCWDNTTVWKIMSHDDFPILQAQISPSASSSPTSTSTSTSTRTQTSSSSPTPTKSSTQTSTGTPASSLSRTHTATSTASSTPTWSQTPSNSPTCTPSVSSTPSITPTASPSSTPSITRTPSFTQTVTITPSNSVSPTPTTTRTVSQTPSVTSSDTRTSTGTATSCSSSVATQTETVTASSTATETTSPSGTLTVSCTATASISSSKTPSSTLTPSLTSTASGTASITPTAKPELEDSGSTSGSSTVENLALNFGSILGGISLLLLCLFYIVHKRRKNQSATKTSLTMLEQYLKQQCSQIDCAVGDKSSMARDDEGEIERHPFPHGSSDLTTGHTKGNSGRRRFSSVKVGGSTTGRNVNPLRATVVSELPSCGMQNIRIVESNALKDSKGCSAVKVVSVKTPNLREASKKSETTKLQLARIEDIDTSGMKLIERSVLKLRKWKAFILAEAPPMVEVEAENKAESGPSTNPLRRDSFIRRLAYAKKVGGDRSVIDSEARSHSLSKREVVSQRQRKKKEFQAAPRTSVRSSFSKPRSHTTYL